MRTPANVGSFLVCILVFGSSVRAQCPTQWLQFGQSCYAFLDDVVPWATAEAFCRMFSSHLLEIESQDENDFITGELHVKGMHGAWLGLNDLLKEGEWRTNSHQQAPVFLNWIRGQPDNARTHEGLSGEDCVWITDSGRWGDLWCEDIYATPYKPAVVCEKPLELSEPVG